MHLFREERILGSYGFKATFPIETDILWQENNRKIGESFDFRKGKYELGLYFSIQDLENYRIDNGKPLKYSITVHPKQ